MYFTTLKLNNGEIENIDLHTERIKKTIFHFYNLKVNIDLLSYIETQIDITQKGIYRLRIDYNSQIIKVEIYEYTLKNHHRILLVENRDFDYSFKYSDRAYFDELLAKNPTFDDIIFTKNGFLTDTTYCNILLKHDQTWFTPSKPLLEGTKRKALLNNGLILEKNIHINDLYLYSEICFINAMRDFEKRYNFEIKQNVITLTPVIV